jgi:DNA invertase Pin-like site-specific DNA recombinase
MKRHVQERNIDSIIIDRLRDGPNAVPLPLVGYMRVSKADGSQVLDLQADALIAAGIPERNLYSDTASGKRDDRPGLDSCLKALRSGDTLVVWKLDRLGRNLRHLVNVVHDLTERHVGLRVLTGQGAAIDTTTAAGKLVFGIFAALAEFERELISERTRAGLAAARARGRKGGRRPKMTPAKLRLASAAMGKRGTVVGDLCSELGITRSTIYRYVSPTGALRKAGDALLDQKKGS